MNVCAPWQLPQTVLYRLVLPPNDQKAWLPNLLQHLCSGLSWSVSGLLKHTDAFSKVYFTENAIKVLHPHDRFHIFLPVHTGMMKMSENALTFYSACVEGVISIHEHKHSTANSQSSLIGARYQLKTTIRFFKWKSTGTETGTGSETHDTDTVAFSNLSILKSVFKSLRFHCFCVDGTWKCSKMFAFSNENAFNNNNNKFISLPKRLFRANLQIM